MTASLTGGDNGSPFKGVTLHEKIRSMNLTSSFSRPRVSNDNPHAEALFRTLKYMPDFPTNGFATIEEARAWVHQFVDGYNNHHRHSAIRYVTPAQRYRGEDVQILAERDRIYHEARQANPARWSRNTRNWEPVKVVSLNPDNPEDNIHYRKAA